jgi:hypothetical protein
MGRNSVPNFFVVSVDILFVVFGKLIVVEQVAVVRTESDVLEGEHILLVFDHQQQILNSDSELTGFVVTRFVGDHHVGLVNDFVAFGYPNGPFVHLPEVPYAVSGSVIVVQTDIPQPMSRKRVHIRTRQLIRYGPFHTFNVQIA